MEQTKNFCCWFDNNISENFEISEISDLKWFLGIKIGYSGNEIGINQEKYVEKMLSRFKMTKSIPITTTLGENEKLTKKDCPLKCSIEQENVKKCDYREFVGCLNYLALSSRPDIQFAANLLSSFLENPGEKHWKAGKNCIRYLLGTKSLTLVYRSDKTLNLISFSDADWAENIDNRRSTSGYCFKLGDNSGVISRSSAFCNFNSRSKTQCCCRNSQGRNSFTGHISDLGIICNRHLEVFVDNQACIALSKHSMKHGKTKHFAIKLHFLRELIEQKEVTLTFLPPANMPADALTKNLGRCKTASFRYILLGTT